MSNLNDAYVFIGIGFKTSVREALIAVGCGISTPIADAMCSYLVTSKNDGTVRKYFSYFQK